MENDWWRTAPAANTSIHISLAQMPFHKLIHVIHAMIPWRRGAGQRYPDFECSIARKPQMTRELRRFDFRPNAVTESLCGAG